MTNRNSLKIASDPNDDFTIRKSDKAKRVTLRVNPRTRAVELVVPKRVSYKYALKFARSQSAWIAAQRDKLAAHAIPMPAVEIKALKREARRVLTALTMEKIALLPTPAPPELPQKAKSKWPNFLQHDFFHMLDVRAPAKHAQKWTPASIKIRINDAKTQWGSCHPDGRISYSWRLMLAPPEARDYVVAHEVAHLIHHNHSRKFWALCETLSHDFASGHKWMKEHGAGLHHYGINQAA